MTLPPLMPLGIVKIGSIQRMQTPHGVTFILSNWQFTRVAHTPDIPLDTLDPVEAIAAAWMMFSDVEPVVDLQAAAYDVTHVARGIRQVEDYANARPEPD